MLTGCGHAGIINICRYAQRLTGVENLHAIIGGFHLTGPLFEPVIGGDKLRLPWCVFRNSPGIRPQWATSAHGADLVRIEGVRGSNPLSSTERSSRFGGAYFQALPRIL